MVRTPQAQLSFAGLSGRPVGVIVGSTAIPALRALSRDSRLKVLEVPGRDDADIFALLEQGRVEAIAGSSLVLATLRALAVEPQAYAILPPVLRSDPLALMFRLEDEPLHALANEVVAAMMRSGEMERIHRKWFQQPPPTALQRLFDSPGSEAGAL